MQRYLRSGVAIIALVTTGLLMQALGDSAREQRESWPLEESYVNLPPASAARWAYLGYNELAADITWARLLVYYGSGFLGEGDFRYLGKFIRNIMTLDPRFKRLYQWAAYTVTVTADHKISFRRDDVRQSIEILEAAMKEFPDDYEFFWLAGIRYFLDLKSEDEAQQRAYKERGAEYLEMAMQKPNAPSDLASKAAAFRSQLGQFEQARANLIQMIMTTDDPRAQEKMLASFGHLTADGVAEELAEAARQFRALRLEHMQQVPSDLFVLMGGPPPSEVIDFDELATERDLFGSQEIEGIQLFD